MILDGRLVATHIQQDLADKIKKLSTPPQLAVVLVGKNPASLAYIAMKEKRAKEIGIQVTLHSYPDTISEKDLAFAVSNIANNTRIHGIIVQAPLPDHINIHAIVELIPAKKDVDGFTKTQIGNMFLGNNELGSCTPKGIMKLLQFYDIPILGKKVTIVGRSNIVGKPLALMMINAGATVTSCNSHTPDIASWTKQADIVVVAVGKKQFLSKDMVSPQATVIDVGSNLDNGKFVGDVDFLELETFVANITPSPGGVGPMTIAMLLSNTYTAYLLNEIL